MNKPIGSLFTIAGVMALLVTFVPEAVLSSPALPLQATSRNCPVRLARFKTDTGNLFSLAYSML